VKAKGRAPTASPYGAYGNPDDTSRRIAAAHRAIPGGGTSANSAYLFQTANGYQAGTAAQAEGSGTSIFDPVLCELAYRWFCPPGGQVLDPFAGGSVRGIVAAALGRPYTGLELRAEQIAANEAQAKRLAPNARLRWILGDAREAATLAPGVYDFIFSCPPYGDLERYSDDPADLSTMPWPAFLTAYRAIIAAAVGMLAPDRFACFVVGDLRGPDGCYRGLPAETCRAFADAGARLYNDAVLVTAFGSLPLRAGRAFTAGRKLGKTHQNVLVFVKGNPKAATAACGSAECGTGEEGAL